MEYPVCPFQYRRSEHFSHRNIDISHTVFKNRLLLWIIQAVKLHLQICPVAVSTQDVYIFALIQRIDQRLLYLFVYLGVQSIDPDHLVKDFFIILSDLRHRIGNDRKASFLSRNVAVHDLALPTVKLQ